MDKVNEVNLNHKVGDNIQDAQCVGEPELAQKLHEATVTQMKEIEVQKVVIIYLIKLSCVTWMRTYRV